MPVHIGIQLSTGHVVQISRMGSGYETGYYSVSLRVYLEQISRFNAMLPLYTSADVDAEPGFGKNVWDSIERVESMLNELDPLATTGVWKWLSDNMAYGDYADVVAYVPTPEEGDVARVTIFRSRHEPHSSGEL